MRRLGQRGRVGHLAIRRVGQRHELLAQQRGLPDLGVGIGRQRTSPFTATCTSASQPTSLTDSTLPTVTSLTFTADCGTRSSTSEKSTSTWYGWLPRSAPPGSGAEYRPWKPQPVSGRRPTVAATTIAAAGSRSAISSHDLPVTARAPRACRATGRCRRAAAQRRAGRRAPWRSRRRCRRWCRRPAGCSVATSAEQITAGSSGFWAAQVVPGVQRAGHRVVGVRQVLHRDRRDRQDLVQRRLLLVQHAGDVLQADHVGVDAVTVGLDESRRCRAAPWSGCSAPHPASLARRPARRSPGPAGR